MTTTQFRVITAWRIRRGKCPVCGKGVQRKVRASQTVSPFNLNADGTVRTVREVIEAVGAEVDASVPDFTHAKCKNAPR